MQNFKQYLVDTLKEAGLTDDMVTSAIDKIANNEKVSSKLNALVKTATEDYEAQVGRQKAAETKLTAAEQRAQTVEEWYHGKRDAAGNLIQPGAKDRYAAMQAELEALKNGNGYQSDVDQNKFITRDDFVKSMGELANTFGGRVKETLRIATRHASAYGEELNVDEFESVVAQMTKENGGQPPSLTSAYEKYIQPRADKKRNEEFEARIKREREEAVKEALSRHSLPAEPVPAEQSPLWAKVKPGDVPANMDQELMAAWHGVGKK